ncbi:(2Fe-2S) ferredoxin domain-containing protein [archaeon]|jgi:(2Fe-2S) ferredoxin|nr:(2Fe-2S) ferredoxin domain-containing protein [archaeon]MBT4351841.1 (2Fe-2S) ferredoxin domain-containing protein [archaeon]MBT4647612.1 (2Fe-2S) ferredoxin domain-containing protein [archaeon]MBT6822588.1 (2Fe-2S) ferredoxin domain-containing protein [archaeon]MBT7392773.1 (2Fe-2S) ferredoxin domain-containing protein [archaeon]
MRSYKNIMVESLTNSKKYIFSSPFIIYTMELHEPYYEKHILVCVIDKSATGKNSCGPKDAEEIWKKLKSYVKENNLKAKIRVSKTYCLDLCSHGPIVTIYPENTVYKQVKLSDVEEIIKKHLIN